MSPSAGQEDRTQARGEAGIQGDDAADAACDRRGQEDRLSRLSPPWWQRDPVLLGEELRSIRAAGFRVHRQGEIATGALELQLARGGERYELTYPCGFPAVGAIASAGWDLPDALHPRVISSRARAGGSGALALADLVLAGRRSADFNLRTFGVLLTGPWESVDDGEGGRLEFATSGRGRALLPLSITGTQRAKEIAAAASELAAAFDGPRGSGWWVRGDAPRWDEGPAGIAQHVESTIARHHSLGRREMWRPARPLLAMVFTSALPGLSGWTFISRGTNGARELGMPHLVSAESFRVRAPYADLIGDKRVTVVGCGSLGWPIAVGLARAGVRRFRLVDADRLYAGNLARLGAGIGQISERKTEALRGELLQVASGMEVTTVPAFVGDLLNAHGLAGSSPDLLIDAAADEATPNETNAAAITLGVPAIYAWMTRGVRSARIFRVVPGRTACYACVANAHPRSLVDEPRPDAREFTWIGANFNIDPIAAAAVRMAVRTLAGDPMDATNPDHIVLRVGGPVPVPQTLTFRRDPRCRWCGEAR